jgi:hypothetical protein
VLFHGTCTIPLAHNAIGREGPILQLDEFSSKISTDVMPTVFIPPTTITLRLGLLLPFLIWVQE